jgi:hypothetical protein
MVGREKGWKINGKAVENRFQNYFSNQNIFREGFPNEFSLA